MRLLSILLFVAHPALAQTSAVVVRARTPKINREAGLVAHFLQQALRNGGVRVVELEPALGNPDMARFEADMVEVQRLYDTAKSAFLALELESATVALGKALERINEHAGHVSDFDLVADVLLLQAANMMLQGQEKVAEEHIARTLLLNEAVEPDPSLFNPDMRKRFGDIQRGLSRKRAGALDIKSAPGGARVFLNGAFIDAAPASIPELAPGPYFVRLVREGYRSYGTVATVRPGSKAELSAELVPADTHEEYEGLLEMATGGAPPESESFRVTVKQLGGLLNVDRLYLVELEREPQQLRLVVRLYDTDTQRRLVEATHLLATDARPATYQREMTALVEQKLLAVSLRQEPEVADPENPEETPEQKTTSTLGTRETIVLSSGGGGLLLSILGATFGYLATLDHDTFRATLQTQTTILEDLQSGGRAKALVGDISAGVGVAALGFALVYYLLVDPVAEVPVESGEAAALWWHP